MLSPPIHTNTSTQARSLAHGLSPVREAVERNLSAHTSLSLTPFFSSPTATARQVPSLARSSSSTSHNYLCSRSFRPVLPPPSHLPLPTAAPAALPLSPGHGEGRQGLCRDGVGCASVSSSFPSFTINAHVLVHSFVRLWLCGLLGRSSSSGSLIWFSMRHLLRSSSGRDVDL